MYSVCCTHVDTNNLFYQNRGEMEDLHACMTNKTKAHFSKRICGSYCYMSRIVQMLLKVLRLGSTTYICTCTVGRFSGTISNLSTHCTHNALFLLLFTNHFMHHSIFCLRSNWSIQLRSLRMQRSFTFILTFIG